MTLDQGTGIKKFLRINVKIKPVNLRNKRTFMKDHASLWKK